MESMDISHYVNERPTSGQRRNEGANQTGRSLFQWLFLSFGLLCIIQAVLNISLRLTLHSKTHSDCNATHFNDQNQAKEAETDCKQRCSKQPGIIKALLRDRHHLENQVTQLVNKIKDLEDETNRLKFKLNEQRGCRVPQQCPAGWMKINSRCYFLSTEVKPWEESRKYCLSKNADLAVIKSEQEQKALYRLNGDEYLLFWIGLYNTAGTFRWVDGSPLTKTFWQTGQPDHGGPNNREDCVEMYHFNPVQTSWNDAPCGRMQRWICEKDPS